MGSLPVEVRPALLLVQGLSDRDDLLRFDPHHSSVHRGALRGHLSPYPGADHVQPIQGNPDHHGGLDLRVYQRSAVSHPHADDLLRGAPCDERDHPGISGVYHPQDVVPPDGLRVPVLHIRAVRAAHGTNFHPLCPHRDHTAPLVWTDPPDVHCVRLASTFPVQANGAENAGWVHG